MTEQGSQSFQDSNRYEATGKRPLDPIEGNGFIPGGKRDIQIPEN